MRIGAVTADRAAAPAGPLFAGLPPIGEGLTVADRGRR